MNRQEFEERTGFHLSEEEYGRVEHIYLDAGDLTKDEFCADYKKHADSTVLAALAEKVQELRRQLAGANAQLLEVTGFLVREGARTGNGALRRQAIAMVGEKEYIRRKISERVAFDTFDYNLLWELIK